MNNKVELECQTCSCKYFVQYYRKDSSKFCSKECMNKRVVSKETKIKMSESKSKNPTKYWLGKSRSDETKSKIKTTNIGKKQTTETVLKRVSKISGPLNPRYKHGLSSIYKKVRRYKKYKEWRTKVFERDGYTCQSCGFKGYVTAHHIKSFASIIKEYNIINTEGALKCEILWDVSNGITLCEQCHSKTDNYKGRNKNK